MLVLHEIKTVNKNTKGKKNYYSEFIVNILFVITQLSCNRSTPSTVKQSASYWLEGIHLILFNSPFPKIV